jgi:hypothetical protein
LWEGNQKCIFLPRCALRFTRKEQKSGGKVAAALYFTVKSQDFTGG